MQKDYSFNKILVNKELIHLKNKWTKNLTSPQDGMWESFRDSATHYEIRHANKMIGYASVGDNNVLLQFYILPEHLSQGNEIFREFIQKMNIKNGIVGTNNPAYLSIALHFVKTFDIHTYLFRESFKTSIEEREGILKECQTEDLNRIVDFCHYSVGAPKEWLTGYIGGLIKRKEVFVFEKDNKIIGTCEVRKSETATDFADIGMIISPDFRRKGYGTYLLHKAKTIALEKGKIPICSCEKGNIGSLKSIHNCGFVSKHQLLSIGFK